MVVVAARTDGHRGSSLECVTTPLGSASGLFYLACRCYHQADSAQNSVGDGAGLALQGPD